MADTDPTTTSNAPTPEPAKIIPLLSPILAMLGSRKGVVALGAIGFCTVVYWREPSKLPDIFKFLTVVIPAYYASQAYEDRGKNIATTKATITTSTPTKDG